MPKAMRTNSPISDAEPFSLPETKPTAEKPKTDWEKLGRSRVYPHINEYLEQRKAYFQRYLPSGVPVDDLREEDRVANWGPAVTIIKEIEQIQQTIALHSTKR